MTLKKYVALAALAWISTAVIAHTPLKSTNPENGSTLSKSPESVSLEFAQAVRLTQLRVELANSEKRRLEFSPKETSTTYTSSSPDLVPGRNVVHWTALSADGHVIEGTIIVVIQPDR